MKFIFLLISISASLFSSVHKEQLVQISRNFELKLTPYSTKNSNLKTKVKIFWELELKPLSEGGNGGATYFTEGKFAGPIILGGSARHPSINSEAIVFILCHELGHALNEQYVQPAYYTEEAADHFAAKICLKKYWSEQNKTSLHKLTQLALLSSIDFLQDQFDNFRPGFYQNFQDISPVASNVNHLSVDSPSFLKCRYQRLLQWSGLKKTENKFKNCFGEKFTYEQ